MRRSLYIALIFLVLAPLYALVPASAVDKQPRKIVSGWIPYYSVKSVMPFIKKLPTLPPPAVGAPVTCADNEYSVDDLAALNSSYLFTNKDLMKEVMPFWYTLKSPTLIRDDYTTGNPSWPIADTLCLMRKTGLKIIPTITDGTDKLVLSGYLANAQNRTAIISSIMDLVMKNSFDGIDLDFEGFAFVDGSATWSKTAPSWIQFINELSTALHAKQKLLSVTSPYAYDPTGTIKGYTVYSWAAIAAYIDRLRIMTYDYSVAKPGPIGPISWVDKTVQYALSIMPASKIFIGLPGYGRDWITSVTGTCPESAPPGLTVGAKAATFKMNYATTKATIDQAVPVFDATTSEMTYSYTQNFNGLTAKGAATACTVGRTVWYQNDRSYTERMNLVAKYQLGGSALWTLGMEDPTATTAMRNVALAIAPDTVLNTLTIDNASSKNIFYGGIFTLRGLVTLKDLTPIAGMPVTVQMKRDTETNWTTIALINSAGDGTLSVPITIAGNTTFRLSTDGTWDKAESLSSEEKVVLLSRIIFDRPSTVKHGAPLVIKGTLLPMVAAQSVGIQKYVSGKWSTIAATTTGTSGDFLASIIEGKKGVVKLRIQITTKSEQVFSQPFSVVVR